MTKSWPQYASCTGTYNSCPLKNTSTTRNTDSIVCTYKSNIWNVCSNSYTVKKTWGLSDAKSKGMVSMVCKCKNSAGQSLTSITDSKCYYQNTSATEDMTPGATDSTSNSLACMT
jgi:hypothetical protein